jgi:hypothetical protein
MRAHQLEDNYTAAAFPLPLPFKVKLVNHGSVTGESVHVPDRLPVNATGTPCTVTRGKDT